MRDLTAEELALAPEWATHYSVNTSSNWISVCFFNERRAVNLTEGQIGDVYFNEFGIEDGDREIVRMKPFDITQHEWSDERLSHDGDTLNVEHESCGSQLDSYEVEFLNLELRKKDAIAIAKHFKLTAEDLK